MLVEDTLLIAGGAAVGAVARKLVSEVTPSPWGTLVVNVVGSGVLGALAASPSRPKQMLVLGVGFCGALTTFSTFSVDMVQLVKSGAFLKAGLFLFANNGLGIGAAAAGYFLRRKLLMSSSPKSNGDHS